MVTEEQKQIAQAMIAKIHKKSKDKREKEAWKVRDYFELRQPLSYWWAIFIILLGARECGKSYSACNFYVDQFINKGRPFYWMRLTDKSAGQLLMNNAEKLVDPDIRRRYNLDLVTVGNRVYHVTKRTPNKIDDDGNEIEGTGGKIVEKKLMCTVLSLSNFYNDKGSGYYDKDFLNDPNMYYNIVMDEMNRELNEKKTFDIAYSFVNQIENIVRSTQTRIRVIMIGNKLEDASDLLCLFNFIPEEFGVYKLVKNKKILVKFLNELKTAKTTSEKTAVYKKYENVDFGKRAVIYNLAQSENYKARRKGSIANILTPDCSTFTNEIKTDNALVTKKKLCKPSYIIKFSKETGNWFTIWDSNVIAKYNKEQIHQTISMRPYIDDTYIVEQKNKILELFNTRCFLFRNLITFKQFQKELEILKPKG